ncbi:MULTISPECIES: glutamate-cysteine ligase family protein [Amycolatopsis]|uniref:glutamate-cysteine ligase family protein n=1 Tax=Amycolatopsis TaxID=1813 RepID=UPI001E6096CE|nr:glutamate-cysteine ligase family protein [Amycolatopsis bullii]
MGCGSRGGAGPRRLLTAVADAPTAGVEEEFVLLDTRTGAAVPAAPRILDGLRGEPGVVPEFLRFQIETVTGVCRSLAEVRADLTRLRRRVSEAAEAAGCLAVATFLPGRGPVVRRSDRLQARLLALVVLPSLVAAVRGAVRHRRVFGLGGQVPRADGHALHGDGGPPGRRPPTGGGPKRNAVQLSPDPGGVANARRATADGGGGSGGGHGRGPRGPDLGGRNRGIDGAPADHGSSDHRSPPWARPSSGRRQCRCACSSTAARSTR